MMIAMIPYPGNRIASQTNRGAGSEKELQPTRHLEAAMREIAMQIERRAQADPEIDAKHDWQVNETKMRPERGHTKQLEHDQNRENSDIEFLILKHNEGLERGWSAVGRAKAAVSAATFRRQAVFASPCNKIGLQNVIHGTPVAPTHRFTAQRSGNVFCSNTETAQWKTQSRLSLNFLLPAGGLK
jgi:hypothetical protein